MRESSDFIKVENNLETLGFFSPSSRQLRKRREKVITFKKRIGGETQEVQVTIMASGNRGLPVTIHQDLFRAFQSVLTGAQKEAIRLVKELHRRVGRLNHKPSRKEIDLAEAFIKRNGVGNAERIVESVVQDARELDFSIEHFGQVEEVMDRVVCGS